MSTELLLFGLDRKPGNEINSLNAGGKLKIGLITGPDFAPRTPDRRPGAKNL
jgi:hypothetical protein